MTQTRPLFTTRTIIQLLVFVVLFPVLPLFVSGQWNWLAAWIYALTYIFAFALSRLLVARRYPDLLGERAKFLAHEDTKSWDKALAPLLTASTLLLLVVIGLDKRFGWSPTFPPGVVIAAYGVILFGWVFGSWALLENRFFSGVVRIQHDRGQTVVRTGPYHWIRHPGYAGGLLTYLATPFFLSSWWGVPFALALAAVVIVRTRLEDTTLQAELEGYRAYAGDVHYRLVPGVW